MSLLFNDLLLPVADPGGLQAFHVTHLLVLAATEN